MLYELIDENINKKKSLDSNDLDRIISKLENELDQTKTEINKLLDKKYNDFKPLISKCEKYEKQLEYLNTQIYFVKNELKEKHNLLQNLHDIDQYKQLIEKIDCFNSTITVLDLLKNFENTLCEFTNAINEKSYAKCYEYIKVLDELIKTDFSGSESEHNENSSDEEQPKLFIIKYLTEEYKMQKERLFYEIEQEWNEIIEIKFENNEHIAKIRCDHKKIKHLFDKLNNLFENKFLFTHKLNEFNASLLKLFEKFQHEYNIKVVPSKGDEFQLTFTEIPLQSHENANEIEYKLNIIVQILSYLNKNLFTLDNNLNKKFSNTFFDKFFKLIYDTLIFNSISVKEYDVVKMTKLCEEINNFEKSLIELNYLKTSNDSYEYENANILFKQFKSNIKNIYVRKKCKYLLDKTRDIMKSKDLIFEPYQLLHKNQDQEGSQYNFLKYPTCQISEATRQIVKIVYDTLDEAKSFMESQTDVNLNRQNIGLFCLTAKNIFDLFLCVTPTYHKENFESLPLLSAMGYNDFMYMSHHCLTLSHQYKKVLNETQDTITQTFIDQVPKLKLVAQTLLDKQINEQIAMINEYLNDNNGFIEISDQQNLALFEKSLNRCTIQLTNLANIWRNILPKHIFSQIFGTLLNYICKYLINSILKLEDISTDDGSHMETLLNVLKPCVTTLYATDDISNPTQVEFEAAKYIKLWSKYKYLIVILKSNLSDIADLWSESKGPLALHFEAEEVRHLIRALFMNTDRRANTLAKIV